MVEYSPEIPTHELYARMLAGETDRIWSADLVRARSLLRLGSGDPFYLLGVLAAVYSCGPSLGGMVAENSNAFAVGLPRIATPSIWGGSLVPSTRHETPRIDGAAAGSRGFRKVTISATPSPTIANVSLDDAAPAGHAVTIRASDAGDVLDVDGLDDLGIYGNLLVGAPWSADVVVHMAPSRYPYADAALSIQSDSGMLRLMAEEGTLELFSAAQDVLRKTGAAGIAIIRRALRESGLGLQEEVVK
jgi:hypothetical protein